MIDVQKWSENFKSLTEVSLEWVLQKRPDSTRETIVKQIPYQLLFIFYIYTDTFALTDYFYINYYHLFSPCMYYDIIFTFILSHIVYFIRRQDIYIPFYPSPTLILKSINNFSQ